MDYVKMCNMTLSEVSCNARKKYYFDDDGNPHCYEIMVSDRAVFRYSGLELSEFSQEVAHRLDYEETNRELFGGGYGRARHYVSETEPDKDASALSSRRRAKRKIFDYVICNGFDCFVTLTLDAGQIDRGDYKAVIKKLGTYLDNRVRRNGLRYVGVPELHKNGGLHFHFAMNSDALKLTDSGTVSVRGRKKPIKVSTAKRLNIPPSDWHTVYNVADWKLGFSTAIMTYGDRGAVANYLSKELNKSVQKAVGESGTLEKIGGRWYLSGGKLQKPVVELGNVDFEAVDLHTYQFDCPAGAFKVIMLKENEEMLINDC